MQRFFSEAAAYVTKNRHHRTWIKVMSCLACVVVFCTTYALILPAITLEDNTVYCGLEEHQHTDDCYTQELICGQEEGEGAHTHTEDCYETQEVLVCGQEEGEDHVHTEDCYETQEVLICGQEESDGHVHTEDCYSEPELTCGLEEHTHTSECYQNPDASEETPAAEPLAEETAPAQEFTGEEETVGVKVTVSAPKGAFPEGTTMTVTEAEEEAIQAAADAVDADAADVQAVDITFTNAEGEEIEPAVPISVTLESELVAASEDAVVVHVDNEAQAEVIEKTTVEDEAITFEADAFSVYAIVGTDVTDPRYTVKFYTDNGMTGAPYETQIVKANDTLVRPKTPEILEGYNEFLGWYIGGTAGTDGVWTDGTEVQFGEVSEDWLKANDTDGDGVIQIHARFINAIHVTFYDCQPGTKKDENGNTVEPAIVTTSSMTGGPIDLNSVTAEPWQVGTVFDKWVDKNGDAVNTPYTATEDTSLYATFTQGYSLVFNANGDGASSTPTQYLKGTEVTRTPATPARPGYTFQGWYTEPTGGTQFTFGNTLSADTTVYAHWTAATAKYTVVFWQQKVSDDKDAAEADRTYDYVTYEERSATTGATVSATDADTQKVTSDPDDYTGFHYGRADTNVVVEPDGSTILNVYYDRNLITMTFETAYSYNRVSGNLNTNNIYYYYYYGKYYNAYYDSSWGWYSFYDSGANDYVKNINKNSLYTRTATSTTTYTGLYGQTLAQNNYTWPTGSWQYTNVEDSVTTMTFLDTFILTPATATSVTFAQNNTPDACPIHFYKENEDGNWVEANTVNGSGTNFSISDKYTGYYAYQYSTNGSNWTTLGTPNATTGYYTTVSSYSNLYIRYKRNTYTIDFMNGSEKVDSASLLYGAALNTVTAPSGKNLTYPGASGDAASHYTFLGWYSAPVGGEKLDFTTTTETMPANNLVAYAQWAPEQLTVTYDANGGTFEDIADKPTKTTVTVDYGTKLENVPTPYNKGYTFLGWVDEDGNAWNFETAVTENITLYAQWHTDHVLNVVYYTVDENGNYVLASATDSNQYDDGATAIVRPYGTEGARFIGWRLGSSENGTLYQPGDEIDVSSATDRADGTADYTITLYAVFDELPTTSITFDANGGEFEDGKAQYELPLNNNQGVDLDTIPTPTLDGHKLIGWSKTQGATTPDFTADGEGTEEIAVDNINEGSNILYAVWKEIPKVDLKINKVASGENATPLSGAEFVLYYTDDTKECYYNNGTWTQLSEAVTLDTVKKTTSNDGTTTFTGVEDGQYNLKEIKAPDGYKLLTDVITFTVKDGKVASASGGYTISEDGTTITVPNSTGIELPHTGGPGTWFYTSSGLLIMAGAVMCGYTLRRKRERRTME